MQGLVVKDESVLVDVTSLLRQAFNVCCLPVIFPVFRGAYYVVIVSVYFFFGSTKNFNLFLTFEDRNILHKELGVTQLYSL